MAMRTQGRSGTVREAVRDGAGSSVDTHVPATALSPVEVPAPVAGVHGRQHEPSQGAEPASLNANDNGGIPPSGRGTVAGNETTRPAASWESRLAGSDPHGRWAMQDHTAPVNGVAQPADWSEVEARLRAAWNLCRCRDSVGEQVASDGVRRLLDIAVGFLPEGS